MHTAEQLEACIRFANQHPSSPRCLTYMQLMHSARIKRSKTSSCK